MSFTVPVFNSRCNIATCPVPNTPSVPTPPYRRTLQACNLALGRRVAAPATGGTNTLGVVLVTAQLLLPKLADIRGPQDSVSTDMVEVPAGSRQWYVCEGVLDVGKGFPNEYRLAYLFPLPGSWVAPYS